MNLWIFIVACVYGISTTGHFGNNVTSHSDAEWICDGITAVLFALATRNGKKEQEVE